MIVCIVEDCTNPVNAKKMCKAHYDKQRYSVKKDKLLLQSKQWADNNRDRVRANGKRWRDNNKERIAIKSKHNYSSNKEHYDNYRAKWREENRLKWNAYRSTRRIREKQNGIFLITPKEYRRLEQSPCFYCGSYENPTIDHVVPIVRGGKHSIGNIVVACKSCNSQKNRKTITEWRKLQCA